MQIKTSHVPTIGSTDFGYPVQFACQLYDPEQMNELGTCLFRSKFYSSPFLPGAAIGSPAALMRVFVISWFTSVGAKCFSERFSVPSLPTILVLSGNIHDVHA